MAPAGVRHPGAEPTGAAPGFGAPRRPPRRAGERAWCSTPRAGACRGRGPPGARSRPRDAGGAGRRRAAPPGSCARAGAGCPRRSPNPERGPATARARGRRWPPSPGACEPNLARPRPPPAPPRAGPLAAGGPGARTRSAARRRRARQRAEGGARAGRTSAAPGGRGPARARGARPTLGPTASARRPTSARAARAGCLGGDDPSGDAGCPADASGGACCPRRPARAACRADPRPGRRRHARAARGEPRERGSG